jgi:dihydrofolate synthase/folylpolyglutamate synthase
MGKAIEVADANGVPATQFELLTAGALLAIRDAGLKWAILEAGLGARHDATSAAEPSAVVLTNVGLDHTEYLGGTVEEIAEEKLASLRPGATLVLGTDDPRVLAVARRAGERVGSRRRDRRGCRPASKFTRFVGCQWSWTAVTTWRDWRPRSKRSALGIGTGL